MKQLDRSLSVAVIYNMVDDPSRVDISSVAGSVTELQQTLLTLGHRVQLLRVDKGVGRFVDALEALQPDVVFNLCEGYREWSAGEACIAGLLELLGIPYTGSDPVALAIALDKPLSKQLFIAGQVSTPRFAVYRHMPARLPSLAFPVILKLASEDASIGMTPDNLTDNEASFRRRLRQLLEQYRASVLAEEFIDGREFTVAVFDGEPIVVEEIEFRVEPRLVGFRAKWEADSAEYRGTVPVFAPAITMTQRDEMMTLAVRVCELIGIRDYGRVDFRMNAQGRVYVLEVNPNPDVGIGSGYRRSLEAADISYPDFVTVLLHNALQRGPEFHG
jgi:D-alanine-D-alanine ligase